MNLKVDDQQLSFLRNGGKMGALMLTKNWQETSLGYPFDWPTSLKNILRLILDNGSPMYIAWGEQYSQFYNDSFSFLLKPEIHQIAFGQSTQSAFPELWQETLRPMFARVMMGEAVHYDDFLLPVYRGDKCEEGYFSFSLSPVRNEESDVCGVMVIANETTKRVLGEKKLKEERERLRLIADRVPSFVSYTDPQGNYKFANRAYSEWGKVPLTGIIGTNRKDYIKDEQIFNYLKFYADKAYAGERVSFNLKLPNDGGESLYLEMEYLPDIDPISNEVKGVVHIGIDVTSRKKIEESEERYKSLADTIPQMMWASSPSGRMNFANQRCLQYTGVNSRFKFLDLWIQTIHPLDRPYVSKAWAESMLTGKNFQEEYRIKRFDGVYRWFLGSALPVKDSLGEIIYWNGTATDIDDHKKIARELEYAKEIAENANATKSAFLANMSHEIRTPLGAILGFSELLKHSNITSEHRNHYIETIIKNGWSLTRIIDDILDLAKVEAGKLEIEHTDFSLFDLLNEVGELLKEKAAQKNIYLKLEFEESVPINIYSDPMRLRQIFINIIGNAIKFTDKGGVDVRVKSYQEEDGTLCMTVEVADTGRGLSDEQRSRLFQPFTQADNTTTRQFGGTGLGLALSNRLAEALGGSIEIAKYEVGAGCTFVIHFIAMLGKETRNERTLPSISECFKTPEDKTLKSMRILFADDSIDNQFLVEHFLTLNGAIVKLANDGSEAVDMALAEDFDLVLMDIQMPKIDGYQATKVLLDRGYKSPIYALTAHAMDEEREKTRALGFKGHLTKPLNFAELLQVLHQNLPKL